MLKRHTPSLETVWQQWESRKRARKWLASRPQRPDRKPTPPNSEPWLKEPPQSVSDLVHISDRVAEITQWVHQRLNKS